LIVGLAVAVATAALLVAASSPPARAAAKLEPNDPYWRQSWSQALLRMPEVWGRTTGSENVVIATVDTGVDPTIDDLKGQLVPGWDFVAGDAVPRDTAGHGTHVASVIAARANNGIGIAGYCPGCRIMPVRITRDGSAAGEQIAQGINWAVDHGARIITIGFNSSDESFDEHAAISYARKRGVLVIASAGNTGTEALRFPAGYPEALAVGATNDADTLYFWSSRGKWVPLTAPGCQLVLDPSVGPGTLCGTSFTPAVVAGVAGLMLSLQPGLSPDQIVSTLVATSKPISGIGGGRIDPLAALAAIAPEPPGAQQPPPPPPSPPSPGSTSAPTGTPAAVVSTRTLRLRSGIMRHRMSRVVTVGDGRLDVHLQASRVGDCQISVVLPDGGLYLSLLPPGEPTLRNATLKVTKGKHRIVVDCEPSPRRYFTLSIEYVRATAASSRS
jgi:subtilisin family serine protease